MTLSHLGVRAFGSLIALLSLLANFTRCKLVNFFLIIRHEMSIVAPKAQTSMTMKMTATDIVTVTVTSFCLFGRSDTA